jgi:hypothetical protein
MSGVEIAGLVLGVLPLLIQGELSLRKLRAAVD